MDKLIQLQIFTDSLIYFLKVDSYLKKIKMNKNINENTKRSQTIAVEDASSIMKSGKG